MVAQYSLDLESQITGNGRSTTATAMTGTQPAFEYVRSWEVAAGRFITEDDMTRKAMNVVLGAKVAEDLFDTPANAVGQRRPPQLWPVLAQSHRHRRDGRTGGSRQRHR